MGVWVVATKWLNRTAQGFSPGLASKKIALKGDRRVIRVGRGLGHRYADTLPQQPALFDKPHDLCKPGLRFKVCHHEGPIASHLPSIGSHDFQ